MIAVELSKIVGYKPLWNSERPKGSMAASPIVLCVESEPSALFGRKALLEKEGYIVLASRSVEHALVSLGCVVVDAVLLDYQLPHEGLRSIAEMARRINPRVRVVVYSRNLSPPPRWAGWVDGYVSLDDGPDIVLQRLAQLLNK